MKKIIGVSMFLLVGCGANAYTVCATSLGIPQDSKYVYLNDKTRKIYYQCVSAVEAEEAERAARAQVAVGAIGAGMQSFGQSLQQQNNNVNCTTQCYGGTCFTHCQ